MYKIIKIYFLFLFMIFLVTSCEKMDNNYSKYLEEVKVYSPKVSNLSATEGLKTAVIRWDNPKGDIAKKIRVDFEDGQLNFEQMVDSAVLEDLEIKGYKVSVYTIDEFNNFSVPVSINIFPNGEN